MELQLIGWVLLVSGFILLAGAPGDRAQFRPFGNTGRLIGLIMMAIGVLLIKL